MSKNDEKQPKEEHDSLASLIANTIGFIKQQEGKPLPPDWYVMEKKEKK